MGKRGKKPETDEAVLEQRRRAQYDRIRSATREAKQWLIEYKVARGCKRCGETHPACLDLHHRDPLNKSMDLSRLAQRGNINRLKEEVEKCDVLCANCHRKLHWSSR